MSMTFRDRDDVCVEYEVRGIAGSAEFPYRNGIASLKAAVAIARTYPDVYGDGSATHVFRRYSKRYPVGHQFHHSSGYTHCWRVSSDARLQLIHLYSRGWQTSRLDPHKYAESLPLMRYRASTLQGQLVDLSVIARAIGLQEAAKALSAHAFGHEALPFSGQA
jgi:hypothetical protein